MSYCWHISPPDRRIVLTKRHFLLQCPKNYFYIWISSQKYVHISLGMWCKCVNVVNNTECMDTDLKQSTKHDSMLVFNSRLISPETGKLRDCFTKIGTTVKEKNIVFWFYFSHISRLSISLLWRFSCLWPFSVYPQFFSHVCMTTHRLLVLCICMVTLPYILSTDSLL